MRILTILISMSLSASAFAANSCEDLSPDDCAVFLAVNAERASAGLGELGLDSKCQSLAKSHADDMSAHDFFSHESPNQGSFTDRAEKFDISGTRGENIAYGYKASEVVSGWMKSKGHRANILNDRYRATGVAHSIGRNGRIYFVQCFSGTP